MRIRNNKYGNVKTVVDGIKFDSRKEADRYCELKLLERAGVIKKLEIGKVFPILINGQKVTSYKADFVYEEDGREVVEDSKGYRNRLYLLKRKMLKAAFGIEIKET